MAAVRAEIQQTGYDGHVTYQLYPYIDNPDLAAREAREYLTKVMGQLGIAVE